MVRMSREVHRRTGLVARRVRGGAVLRRTPVIVIAAWAATMAPLPAAPQSGPGGSGGADTAGGITLVEGIRVGHFTYPNAPTGCTVVIADGGVIGGVDVRGGAPGTVETDLLDPVNTVERVDAVFIAGGSAFGLDARRGVMRYLEEREQGYPIGGLGVVPIVPGAIIFDLRVAGGVRPGPDCGYEAAVAAVAGPVAEGSVGAGAGATLGKMRGMAWAMKGGVGTSSVTLESGLVVGALAVVNAVGDVVDPRTGEVVAGARTEDGGFADARRIVRGEVPPQQEGRNTTVVIVATNARLTKAQATKVAQMAQDGLARAIVPSHTPGDGDTVFSLATGALTDGFNVSQVGALAAEVVAEAIVRAAREAHGLPSIPAVRDLPGDGR